MSFFSAHDANNPLAVSGSISPFNAAKEAFTTTR